MSAAKVVGLIFGGIGALLVLLGASDFLKEQRFLAVAESTTGTVVDFDAGECYTPRIEYTTKAGEQGLFFGTCSTPPSYEIGQHVALLYDPGNPGHAQENGFHYGVAAILAGIGLPFLLLGIWAWVAWDKM